jgi:hypothetical protein
VEPGKSSVVDAKSGMESIEKNGVEDSVDSGREIQKSNYM